MPHYSFGFAEPRRLDRQHLRCSPHGCAGQASGQSVAVQRGSLAHVAPPAPPALYCFNTVFLAHLIVSVVLPLTTPDHPFPLPQRYFCEGKVLHPPPSPPQHQLSSPKPDTNSFQSLPRTTLFSLQRQQRPPSLSLVISLHAPSFGFKCGCTLTPRFERR